MHAYLIFGLTASLGAMGELAGHERRGSMIWPARSAILGLLGAALGIRRGGDFRALDALSLAVAVFDEGTALRDYHTVETIPSAAVKNANSRPESLHTARGRTNTAITLRDYRCDAFHGVALWGGALETLQHALAQPKFTLYLGRKSCPLSAPLGAAVVQADSPDSAFAQLVLPPWRRNARARMVIEEADHGEEVHDLPLDRARWHFAPRYVKRRAADIAPIGGGRMTIFFTQMRMSGSPSTRALASLISPTDHAARIDAHHKLIWAAFADTADRSRDFLWREETDGSFFALSARPPVQMDLFDPFVTKPFAPSLSPGDMLSFALRANATRTKRGAGRVDVVMDALHAIAQNARADARPQIAQTEAAAWLERQGAKAGFTLHALTGADYTTLTLPDYRGPRKGQPQFGILDLTGSLTVTDPAAFIAQLGRGFGRAKAFGCGLMLIRRAR